MVAASGSGPAGWDGLWAAHASRQPRSITDRARTRLGDAHSAPSPSPPTCCAAGKVPSPEAKLYDQFPEYADLANQPGRDGLTIHHVLSMADPRTPAAVRDRVTALKANLDPIRLLAEINWHRSRRGNRAPARRSSASRCW